MQDTIVKHWGRLILFFALVFFCAPLIRAQNDAAVNYKAKCAACHGPDGTGNVPAGKALKARDFHDPDVQKETDADLTDIISNGKNKMPKYSDKLKANEIKDLVAYVRDLGKK